VAQRLSYLAEEHSLLPSNHFGGRPQRSAEQALNVVIEHIHNAWRHGKTLSLVSFDVQGAFNGVNADVLRQRLTERRVPQGLADWIYDFCSNRAASIVVGRHTAPETRIEHPGIPQGSPLSPILYVFYNANLIEGQINAKAGSIGFIDDFNVWYTGPSEEDNTQRLQDTVIPHAERWATESGAIFEVDKTAFIHFAPRQRRQPAGDAPPPPLRFGTASIAPQTHVKALGVTLDAKLRTDTHVAKVAAKGMDRCLALAAVRGLRPAQMRQLYRACVVPATDYAASTWYGPGKFGLGRHVKLLQKVQLLGAKIIFRAFKTVALPVLEAEASLAPVADRLQAKGANHAARLLALPLEHPVRQALLLRKGSRRGYASPLWHTIRYSALRLCPLEGSATPQRAWVQAPWERRAEVIATIGTARAAGPSIGTFRQAHEETRTGRLLDGPREKWRLSIEVVKATIRFLQGTQRLDCSVRTT